MTLFVISNVYLMLKTSF